MNFKESIVSGLTNWKNFSGRASRSEFWYFYSLCAFIIFLLGLVDQFFLYNFTGIVSFLVNTVILILQSVIVIPAVSLISRRLQDRSISGWWQLSYITVIGVYVILVLLMLPAKEDENKWGRNPLLGQ
tara:strand:- start:137 stop:520 length:384 start_codon:yes stop_codon:yes gene_type:complete